MTKPIFAALSFVIFTHIPAHSQSAPPVTATPAAGLNFQPAVADPNATQADPLPGDFGPPGAVQTQQQQAAAAQQQALLQQQQAAALAAQRAAAAKAASDAKKSNQMQQALSSFLQNMNSSMMSGQNGQGIDGNPRTNFGDNSPTGPNGTYGDDQTFYYGGKGVGNIGTGLCTSNNANRSQMKLGYCQMLRDALNKEGSCAKRALDVIMARAYPNGNGVRGLNQYCSQFGQLGDNRREVFVQVLASLIVQESGWNPRAQEKPWTKNGQPMGGKGLFQIGVNDRNKDRDCAGLDSNSILDARTNIQCGSCIALSHIAKDGEMGRGSGDQGSVGMARYFGPLRELQSAKRASMQKAVSQYCQGNLGTAVPTGSSSGDATSAQ